MFAVRSAGPSGVPAPVSSGRVAQGLTVMDPQPSFRDRGSSKWVRVCSAGKAWNEITG